MAIVTISRLAGAGGDGIASRVAEGLGYDLVNSSLIIKVAEEAGVSVEYVKSLDERSGSKTVEWLKSLLEPNTEKFIKKKERNLDEKSILNPEGNIEYVKSILMELAKKGDVVIVGRGGQFILKDFENAFHIRIIADLESRVKRLMENHSITESDAREHIKDIDAMRKNYIERFFSADFNDPLAYNMVINTGKTETNLAVKILIEAIKEFSSTREVIAGVKDRRKGFERRREVRRKYDRRSGVEIWTERDIENAVLRGDRAMRSYSKPDRRKTIRRKEQRR